MDGRGGEEIYEHRRLQSIMEGGVGAVYTLPVFTDKRRASTTPRPLPTRQTHEESPATEPPSLVTPAARDWAAPRALT